MFQLFSFSRVMIIKKIEYGYFFGMDISFSMSREERMRKDVSCFHLILIFNTVQGDGSIINTRWLNTHLIKLFYLSSFFHFFTLFLPFSFKFSILFVFLLFFSVSPTRICIYNI